MFKVYIASPYSKGNKIENVTQQIDCASELIDLGLVPFTPLLSHFIHLQHPKSYPLWIKLDIEWIAACDCLLRLEGDSQGADIEVDFALGIKKPVFYSIERLKKHYRIKRNVK